MEHETKQDELHGDLGWYAAPNVLDLSPALTIYEKAVWHNFAAHRNGKTGACYPSRETQAKELGIGNKTVSKARTGLIEKGWLKREPLLDPKTSLIRRYNWTLLVPDDSRSESKRPERKEATGRSHYGRSVKDSPNNTKSKQHQRITGKENSNNTNLVLNGEGCAVAPLTPADEMKLFITSEDKRQEIVQALVAKGVDSNFAKTEIQKFFIYWTERSRSGTKQRWEMERTFEIKRRLVVWLNNAPKFSGWRGTRPLQPKGKDYG